MSPDDPLREGLLKQNGIDPAAAANQTLPKLRAQVAKQHQQVRRMKWATAISWGLLAAGYLVMCASPLLGAGPRDWDSPAAAAGIILWMGLWPISIFLTVSLLIRWRSLGQARIMARLAEIQEQVERLTK